MIKKKSVYVLLFILIISLLKLIVNINQKYFKDYPDDANTLYTKKIDDLKIKFERYDYALGQNQIVGVEVSRDRGKTYTPITEEPIVVSMKPKFIFLNKDLGFAIAKPNLTKYNNYMGFYVTLNGGKTFQSSTIHYNNSNIDILTIEDVPYFDQKVLKLPCSIYQASSNGYENINLIFESNDKGLNWNLISN